MFLGTVAKQHKFKLQINRKMKNAQFGAFKSFSDKQLPILIFFQKYSLNCIFKRHFEINKMTK